MDRVIALIDMDCFYAQVEQRANPALMGLPCAVVQYRPYKGGGLDFLKIILWLNFTQKLKIYFQIN